MKLLLLVVVFGTLFFPPKPSRSDLGRSCGVTVSGRPCEQAWRFDTVFVGTVRKLVNVPFAESNHSWQKYRKVTATLSVEEVFRGEVGEEVVFEMEDCYFEFTENETYLVYTAKGNDGKYSMQRYRSPTRPVSEAAEDLAFLRSLPNTPPGGRIYGEVWDHRGSLSLPLNGEDVNPFRKMNGVTIRLRLGDKTYETISGAEGRFEFEGLPPGDYGLIADLPDFLSGTRQTVGVMDKACTAATVSIQAIGEIRGKLVDEKGRPVKYAVVSIFSADGVTEGMFDRVRPHSMVREITSEDGSFALTKLRSGRYYLAVNMVEEERNKESRAAAYPRFFHPGVTSFSDAQPIEIDDGEKVANIKIKLPPLPGKTTERE